MNEKQNTVGTKKSKCNRPTRKQWAAFEAEIAETPCPKNDADARRLVGKIAAKYYL